MCVRVHVAGVALLLSPLHVAAPAASPYFAVVGLYVRTDLLHTENID